MLRICSFLILLFNVLIIDATNKSITHHEGLVHQQPNSKSDLWSCDSTIIIQEQYGDGANAVLKTPIPKGGFFDNMTCVQKIVSPVHTRILFVVQKLQVARMDRKRSKACRHGAVIVFSDPPSTKNRTLFCQQLPEPIVSNKNKLVIIYKLFRYALKPMEFEAYFTVIYVAKLNNRLTFNISPLLKSHGTISEISALQQTNSSQRWNLKLKKYANCILHIVPFCNGKDFLKIGYEFPLETGSMLFVDVECDEPSGTLYSHRSIIQKRIPDYQLMYIDLEINSNSSDKFSITWECDRDQKIVVQKEIKMIANLPPEKITVIDEPNPEIGQPIRPLVLTSRYEEIKQLENEYL